MLWALVRCTGAVLLPIRAEPPLPSLGLPTAQRAWKAMLKYHSMTFSLWRQMVGYALELEYGKAADLIKVRGCSTRFEDVVQ
eukprot:276078-Chlamydomonas_euryale.AAC.4